MAELLLPVTRFLLSKFVVCLVSLSKYTGTSATTKYGDYEYVTINSVVNKNFDSRFEVICLKILGTELSAWAT